MRIQTPCDAMIMRPMSRDDYPALIEMVRRMWYGDPDMDTRVSRALAKADFEATLSRTTEAWVSETPDGLSGVILGGVAGRRSWRRMLSSLRHLRRAAGILLPLLASREGRRGIRGMLRINAADDRLLRDATRDRGRYDAEVTLLLVEANVRGGGVGRRLFDRMMRTFRAAGVERFFLFTDTTCNFGFYDHLGLVRCGEMPLAWSNGDGTTFYLYDGRV
ncbi:GNAT family N-acetyltransferase [Bifidobacterium vespertilionis]|uniref:GNAT family N-acetyltransferase n=1 Tax=Bifidobacterium vespertilionis TaxID=2562524 RepID=A0A5J5DZC7_9BIFI|nr:GNAT family N-acetyltransferase [Bifidobacterium vespertilionis]KAA8822070.1 GNAT family N-acetyltransferase [Bifidobacterium vespertilionis]KAA8824567.1 GNAT family N-acetyltransferase [Bifidobacterium vespertilionis]